jgi:hypothetical protein
MSAEILLKQWFWAANHNNGAEVIVNLVKEAQRRYAAPKFKLLDVLKEGDDLRSCCINAEMIQAHLDVGPYQNVKGQAVEKVINIVRQRLHENKMVFICGELPQGLARGLRNNHAFAIVPDIVDGVPHARVYHAMQSEHFLKGETCLPIDRFLKEMTSALDGNKVSQQIIFGRKECMGRIKLDHMRHGALRNSCCRPKLPDLLRQWITKPISCWLRCALPTIYGNMAKLTAFLSRCSFGLGRQLFKLINAAALAGFILDPVIQIGFALSQWCHIHSSKSINNRAVFTQKLCRLLMAVFNTHGDHHIMIHVQANYSWQSSGERHYAPDRIRPAGILDIAIDGRVTERMPRDCVLHLEVPFDEHIYNVWVFKGDDVFTTPKQLRGFHNWCFNSSLKFAQDENKAIFHRNPRGNRLHLKGVCLKNRKSGKYLTLGTSFNADVDVGGYYKITQESASNCSTNQSWNLEEFPDGSIQITPKYKKICGQELRFDVLKSNFREGNRVICYISNDTEAQKFRLFEADDKYFIICPIEHPELAIDIKGGSMENGGDVIIWETHRGHNQQFEVCCACCDDVAGQIRNIFPVSS